MAADWADGAGIGVGVGVGVGVGAGVVSVGLGLQARDRYVIGAEDRCWGPLPGQSVAAVLYVPVVSTWAIAVLVKLPQMLGSLLDCHPGARLMFRLVVSIG